MTDSQKIEHEETDPEKILEERSFKFFRDCKNLTPDKRIEIQNRVANGDLIEDVLKDVLVTDLTPAKRLDILRNQPNFDALYIFIENINSDDELRKIIYPGVFMSDCDIKVYAIPEMRNSVDRIISEALSQKKRLQPLRTQ